jgi:hypothetical protein
VRRGGTARSRKRQEEDGMTKKLHQALEAIVPHVGEGSRVFVMDGGHYHRFRVEEGRMAHTETHSSAHVEKGRGSLSSPADEAGDGK